MSRVLGRPGLLLWLTAVWVGLWGSLSAANVLGGLLVATVLLALPLSGGDAPAGPAGLVRPRALLRFVGAFAVDLVRASLQVVALVLRPRAQLRQAVVAVPVTGASDALITMLANAISLTPGTLTLEVDRARGTLYVHVLQVGEGPDAVERVRRDILALEQRAIRAVGSAQARASVGPGGAA